MHPATTIRFLDQVKLGKKFVVRLFLYLSKGAQAPCGLSDRRKRCFDEGGATAVEFAILAPIFLSTILFIIAIGYVLVMNYALDYATQKAARQILTGSVQMNALTQTTFRTAVVCPLLPSLFVCSDVIVNVQAVPTGVGSSYPNQYASFINSTGSGLIVPPLDNTQTNYCPGQQQSYVYLQILYPVNIFSNYLSSSAASTTYMGRKVYLIMSTATFLNEPFVAPASSC